MTDQSAEQLVQEQIQFRTVDGPEPPPMETNLGSAQEAVIKLWQTLAVIMKRGNMRMFVSPQHTRELIRSGEYAEIVKEFHPLLSWWRDGFDKCSVCKLKHPLC